MELRWVVYPGDKRVLEQKKEGAGDSLWNPVAFVNWFDTDHGRHLIQNSLVQKPEHILRREREIEKEKYDMLKEKNRVEEEKKRRSRYEPDGIVRNSW